MTPIAPHVTAFFQKRLAVELRASRDTCVPRSVGDHPRGVRLLAHAPHSGARAAPPARRAPGSTRC